MKKILLTTVLATLGTSAYATENVQGRVKDHYVTRYETVTDTKRVCQMVDVPVYETRQRQGDAAGSALLGMIIGGATGKVITGKDNGAAAGAIMGGIIGADKGSRTRTEQVIVGYKKEQSCAEEIVYIDVPQKVYSYSTLGFTLNGKRYTIEFVK